MLDEAPRILFPKPVLRVDLRVRFRKPLIPEVQSAGLFFAGLRAVHDARGDIEPVGEFVDEEGSHGGVIGAKSGGRGNLNAKVGAVALAQAV